MLHFARNFHINTKATFLGTCLFVPKYLHLCDMNTKKQRNKTVHQMLRKTRFSAQNVALPCVVNF